MSCHDDVFSVDKEVISSTSQRQLSKVFIRGCRFEFASLTRRPMHVRLYVFSRLHLAVSEGAALSHEVSDDGSTELRHRLMVVGAKFA